MLPLLWLMQHSLSQHPDLPSESSSVPPLQLRHLLPQHLPGKLLLQWPLALPQQPHS